MIISVLIGSLAVVASFCGTFMRSRLACWSPRRATELAIVDPASGRVLASVPEGGITGHEVIASADGKLASCPSTATPA